MRAQYRKVRAREDTIGIDYFANCSRRYALMPTGAESIPELLAKLTEARLMRDWPTEGDEGGTCALEDEALRETITVSESGSGSELFVRL